METEKILSSIVVALANRRLFSLCNKDFSVHRNADRVTRMERIVECRMHLFCMFKPQRNVKSCASNVRSRFDGESVQSWEPVTVLSSRRVVNSFQNRLEGALNTAFLHRFNYTFEIK